MKFYFLAFMYLVLAQQFGNWYTFDFFIGRPTYGQCYHHVLVLITVISAPTFKICTFQGLYTAQFSPNTDGQQVNAHNGSNDLCMFVSVRMSKLIHTNQRELMEQLPESDVSTCIPVSMRRPQCLAFCLSLAQA